MIIFNKKDTSNKDLQCRQVSKTPLTYYFRLLDEEGNYLTDYEMGRLWYEKDKERAFKQLEEKKWFNSKVKKLLEEA